MDAAGAGLYRDPTYWMPLPDGPMTTGSHSEPCINWPCAKGAGHAGPCGTSRDDKQVTADNRLDGTTHADDCWSWGPGHYECAVRKIGELVAELREMNTERLRLRDEMDAMPEAAQLNAGACIPPSSWKLVPEKILVEARNTAMEWTVRGRAPESGVFSRIAQDLDAALAAACDSDTIRELLAERDQLAAALEAAREDACVLRRDNERLAEALRDAATSMQTIADKAGRDE